MRKWLLGLLLFLGTIPGLGTAAEATGRHRFLVVEGNSPQKTAQLVRSSLVRDPTGRAAIYDLSCTKFRACGTPEDLVDMAQRSDDREFAPKDVSELPAYLDSLVLMKAPPGQYWMACKTGITPGSAPKWDCMTRVFHAGEPCFGNPKTGRCVLARDCTNWVGREQHEDDCVELHPFLKKEDELHVGYLSTVAFPSDGRCKLSVQKTGEQERSSYDMDECPRDTCDFSGPSAFLRLPVQGKPRISWTARVTGDNIIRVPRAVLETPGALVLCIVRPGQARQSYGVAVFDKTYVDNKMYVTYQSETRHIKAWKGKAAFWKFTDGGTE